MKFSKTVVLFVLSLATTLGPTLPAASQTFTRIVDTTDAVPGGQPGELFSINEPELPQASNRCVAFLAYGDMGSTGVYLRRQGVLELVVDLDTPVPGGAFTDIDAFSLDDCDVAYGATVNPTGSAIFLRREGAAADPVASTSTAVPGEPGTTFDEVAGPWLSGGKVAFFGRYSTVHGIFIATEEGVEAVVDSSSTGVPGGQAGEIFTAFDGIALLDDGNVVFWGEGPLGTEGIYTDLGGALRAVADNATSVPGGQAGEVFGGFFDSAILTGGEVYFSGAGTIGTVGIFRESGGSLEMFHDLAEPPPGWLPGEVLALDAEDPFFFWASEQVVSFYALGDMGSKGIYRTDSSDVTAVIATGDPLDGTAVTDLLPIVHADGDRSAFAAELDDGRRAIFVADFELFGDGFETGDASAWSATVP